MCWLFLNLPQTFWSKIYLYLLLYYHIRFYLLQLVLGIFRTRKQLNKGYIIENIIQLCFLHYTAKLKCRNQYVEYKDSFRRSLKSRLWSGTVLKFQALLKEPPHHSVTSI
jgi:hypothetical protein